MPLVSLSKVTRWYLCKWSWHLASKPASFPKHRVIFKSPVPSLTPTPPQFLSLLPLPPLSMCSWPTLPPSLLLCSLFLCPHSLLNPTPIPMLPNKLHFMLKKKKSCSQTLCQIPAFSAIHDTDHVLAPGGIAESPKATISTVNCQAVFVEDTFRFLCGVGERLQKPLEERKQQRLACQLRHTVSTPPFWNSPRTNDFLRFRGTDGLKGAGLAVS